MTIDDDGDGDDGQLTIYDLIYYLMMISDCLFNISPHAKFYPKRMKNTQDENWSVLVGQSACPKND